MNVPPVPLLVTLVGEQPIPPLLAIRALRPRYVLMVTTTRHRAKAERLAAMVAPKVYFVEVDGEYRFGPTQQELDVLGPLPVGTVIDLTGGAKTTALALVEHARRPENSFPIRFVYLRSHVGGECLDELVLNGPAAPLCHWGEHVLPPLLTADEYLRAHVGAYHPASMPEEPVGPAFERAVAETLQDAGYEVLANVCVDAGRGQREIDLVVRAGNQVGIVETKLSGRDKPKQGLDQLVALAQREAFGTFVRRFLVLSRPLNARLQGLALEQGVCVVHQLGGRFESATETWHLSASKREHLVAEVRRTLGSPPDLIL